LQIQFKKIKIEFDKKNPRRIQFNENKKRKIISNKININYKNKNQILKIKKIIEGENKNICTNYANSDKHSNLKKLVTYKTYETLDLDPIKKFITNQF